MTSRRKQDKSDDREKTLPAFLEKTYSMIENSPEDIAGWSPAGDTFIVKNPIAFADTVIPEYFKHRNFSSFVRQLNFYGFRKMKMDASATNTADPKNWWEFKHEKFVRGGKEGMKDIRRKTYSDAGNADKADIELLKMEVACLRGQLTSLTQSMQNVMDVVSGLLGQATCQNDIGDPVQIKKRKTSIDEGAPYTPDLLDTLKQMDIGRARNGAMHMLPGLRPVKQEKGDLMSIPPEDHFTENGFYPRAETMAEQYIENPHEIKNTCGIMPLPLSPSAAKSMGFDDDMNRFLDDIDFMDNDEKLRVDSEPCNLVLTPGETAPYLNSSDSRTRDIQGYLGQIPYQLQEKLVEKLVASIVESLEDNEGTRKLTAEITAHIQNDLGLHHRKTCFKEDSDGSSISPRNLKAWKKILRNLPKTIQKQLKSLSKSAGNDAGGDHLDQIPTALVEILLPKIQMALMDKENVSSKRESVLA